MKSLGFILSIAALPFLMMACVGIATPLPEPTGVATPRLVVLTVKVTPEDTGRVQLIPSPSQDGSYPSGTNVLLTAVPNPDFQFVSWADHVGGSTNPISVTIKADTSLIAVFGTTAHSQRAAANPPENLASTRTEVPEAVLAPSPAPIFATSPTMASSPTVTAPSAITPTLEPTALAPRAIMPTYSPTRSSTPMPSLIHIPTPGSTEPTPQATTARPGPTDVSTPTRESTPTPDPTTTSEVGGCVSDPTPQFTAPITDLSKIDFILAPMVISGNRFKSRSYVWIGRDQNNKTYEVPVYAPVDSKLTWITFYAEQMRTHDGALVGINQYSLTFEVSCEVSYGFDHILRLAGNIEALAPSVATESTRDTGLPQSLRVKAGDLIGYTTGTAAAHNWDFVFKNSSKRNEFANQERYENVGDLRGLVTADCPYDYYIEDVRSEYYLLLNGGINGTIQGTDCLISHDKPGTIAGGWFREPFSRDDSHPYIPGWALAIGTWANGQIRVNDGQTSVWVNPGHPTYANPKTVTSEHCYEHPGNQDRPPARFVYLRLLSETELAVAFGQGSCPQQLPQDYQIYYR